MRSATQQPTRGAQRRRAAPMPKASQREVAKPASFRVRFRQRIYNWRHNDSVERDVIMQVAAAQTAPEVVDAFIQEYFDAWKGIAPGQPGSSVEK